MKVDDVITLLNAGYTREEIRAMEGAGSEPVQEALAEPVEADPVPEEAPADLQKSAADMAKAFDEAIAKMTSAFDDRIKQIQTANVQAARLPEDKTRTVDDIIGDIIKPTMGRRVKED